MSKFITMFWLFRSNEWPDMGKNQENTRVTIEIDTRVTEEVVYVGYREERNEHFILQP